MSDPLHIPPGERHILRVFALSLPDPARLAGDGPALAALLGLPQIDPAGVEVFETADLSGVGLSTYLTEGDGVAEEALAADRDRLDALKGWVLILRSEAVTGPVTLAPAAALTFLGRYGEDIRPVRFEPLPSAAAEGLLPQGKPRMSDARMSGMVATAVLLLMFLFVAVFVWMAGK